MAIQEATVYRIEEDPTSLGADDWSSIPGWQKMRGVLHCSTLETHLAKLDGKWVEFIMDENGRMKHLQINPLATDQWRKATNLKTLLVGDVIILHHKSKPRR